MRALTLFLPLLLATPALAQQGYEFGQRFEPQNFDPIEFRGFSFRGTPTQRPFGQPLQFNTIQFPVFSSGTVRREFLARSRTPSASRPVAVDAPPRPVGRPTTWSGMPSSNRVTARRGPYRTAEATSVQTYRTAASDTARRRLSRQATIAAARSPRRTASLAPGAAGQGGRTTVGAAGASRSWPVVDNTWATRRLAAGGARPAAANPRTAARVRLDDFDRAVRR